MSELLDRIRGALIGLRMPRALEALDHTLTQLEQGKISRRASRLLELREAATGLNHLRRDDRDRLEVLREGARLIQLPSTHRADELAAPLHAEMPWMATATEIVWLSTAVWKSSEWAR